MVKDQFSKDSNKFGLDTMDAALQNWVDSVPDHRQFSYDLPTKKKRSQMPKVQWDSSYKCLMHFKQSALLRASYYAAQIIAHQPFIESSKDPVVSASSAAICSKAAKACIHLVSTAHEALEMSLHPFLVGSGFHSFRRMLTELPY